MLCIKNSNVLKSNNVGEYYISQEDILIENGTITYVGELPKTLNVDQIKVIDGSGQLAMPGLINAHYHSHNTFFKGLGENLPLEPWVYYAAFATHNLEREDIYIGTLLGCIEMIKSGVTTCLDHLALGLSGIETALKAYEDAGFRVALAPMVSDLPYYKTLPINNENEIPESILKEMKYEHNDSIENIINMCKKIIDKWHNKQNGLITVMMGPSGPQRCSTELLQQLHRLAQKHDLGIHTHFLETKIQAQTAFKKYNKSMGEYLADINILDERWSLAHTVWASDKDIKELTNSKAMVVHSPESNLQLGSGIAPIIKYKKQNIKVALGTDSCNCGGNLSLFKTMSLAAILSKITTPKYNEWLHSKEILKMATENSAKALRLEEEIGSIEVGKKGDIVLLNLDTTFLSPTTNLIHQLVYSEIGTSVETVIIEGRIVMLNKEILTFDENKVIKAAQKRYKKLEGKIDKSIKNAEQKIEVVKEIYEREIVKDIGFHRSGSWGK